MASAHDIEVQNADGITIYYNYINGSTELEVTYRGEYETSWNEYEGKVIIPQEVTYMGRTRKVTSIGRLAFSDCIYMTSITIPNSVTNIASRAFYYCKGLTSIAIPNSVTSIEEEAFSKCSELTSITIPNSITIIGNNAFQQCTGLTSVTIPNSVISIGEGAFVRCTGLQKVIVPDISAWCKIEFANSDSNPLNYAHHLFVDASTEITELVLPSNVTSIGNRAFSGCSRLTSVTIPNNVTNIGLFSFSGCSNLTSIIVESGNTKYDSRENCNAIIETATNTLVAGCQSTVIPSAVTIIGSGAFSGCSNLSSIIIPDGVTSIGNYAFAVCSNLTYISIPNSVTNIEKGAFNFTNSEGKIVEITSLRMEPQNIDENAFHQDIYNNSTLYIPNGTKEKYKVRKGWKNFIWMEEKDMTGIEAITNDVKSVKHRYTLDGKRVNEPQKGVNIVRMGDGTTKKTVVK